MPGTRVFRFLTGKTGKPFSRITWIEISTIRLTGAQELFPIGST
jgi:hypothetical protein